jgi:signal transduction histidine kinase
MGGLYLMRPDDQTLELVVRHNLPRDYTGTILHLGEGLSGRVAQTGKPMMVDDHLYWEGRAGVYADIQTRRVLGVPLKVGERVVGVINVTDDQKVGPFDEDQVRLLSLFADQAAIVVENARLVEALTRHDREMATLYETSLEINSQPDVSTLIHAIVRRAAELLGTQTGALYQVGTDGETLKLVVSHNLPPHWVGITLRLGEGLAGRVAQIGEPMMVDDYLHWEERVAAFADTPARRVLGVPLKVRDQITGVVIVIDPRQAGLFSKDEVRLLSLFADQAAIAVENARLVEALRQSNAELETRNEELDAFAHTVAHDLKNPVGPVVGFAEILIRDHTIMTEDERQRCIEAIARSGRKIKSIIEELLLLAEVRQVQVATEPLDMSRIVSEALQRLTDAVEQSRAEIVWPDVSAWPVALGYAPWVEEVWINYLSNALKYGGRPPRIELGAKAQPEGMTRFWVRDNGPGIPPEAQSRLFTPFTRLDQVRAKGHGLGLSIVRRIVEKLGGQVGVESQTGQGSAFYFTLPGAPI